MAKKYFYGLTLVELMIVLAIIAILAALIISIFTGQIFKGNDSKRKGDLDRIKIAVEEYEKDHNCYPQSVSCLSPSILQPYLDRIPCDPVTHSPYPYEPDPDTLSCPRWFRIYAVLQNSQDLSLLLGIGPNGAYNYYVDSGNIPHLNADPIALCTGDDYSGCINGECKQIGCDAQGAPVCVPNYPNLNCNGNDCGSPQSQPCK